MSLEARASFRLRVAAAVLLAVGLAPGTWAAAPVPQKGGNKTVPEISFLTPAPEITPVPKP